MAKISFANLTQDFTLWRDEIDNHATQKTSETFSTATASGHLVTIQGAGLEYQTGVPRNGLVHSLKIDLGGGKPTPDVTIDDIYADFKDYAEVVSAPSPIDRTMALWSATLADSDGIDFGANTSANNLRIDFAGDGYEARNNAFGGDDVLRGDIGRGGVTGDFFLVGANRTAFGGDDDIQLLNSKNGYVSGDILQDADDSHFFAGDDLIRLAREGTAVGDASNIRGAFVAGDDTIFGSDESDYLVGDVAYALYGSSVQFGDDLIHGGGGDDYIHGDYSSNEALNFRVGNDQLFGDAGSDFIFGEDGNDYLDGGTEGDYLDGGAGRDTIRGGAGQDTLIGGQGIDTADYGDKARSVEIRLDHLGAATVQVGGVAEEQIDGFENLAGGSAGDKLVGANDYTSNVLEGRGGNDTLDGGGGNDTLIGGSGKDVLIGGAGVDQFRFDSKPSSSNVDKIADFLHGSDKIALDDTIFAALGATFEKAEFVVRSHGHTASTASQHVIYDRSNGTLWYDSDGRGSHAAVQVAQLGTTSAHPTNLSWDDFAIV